MPKHVAGFDIFFQAAEGLVTAEWLRNGKAGGSIPIRQANDVFWYGYSPPGSPFVASPLKKHRSEIANARRDVVAGPRVVLFWRQGSGKGASTFDAPVGVDGIDIAWFLNKPVKGCLVLGSQAWTSPPMPVEFTTGGLLNSRVRVLQCPFTRSGSPVTYNGADFVWRGVDLAQIVPTFDGSAVS